MKSLYLFALILLALLACKTENQEQVDLPSSQSTPIVQDTTPRVTGIGGVFFGTSNPDSMRIWYGANLGLAIDDYGSPFEFRNANNPDEINYLRWAPMPEGSEYMSPGTRDFMVNYRVYNIEALVRQLKVNGVTVLDSVVDYGYGKFAHILDPDSNKIELWEPVDSALTAMGGMTTK